MLNKYKNVKGQDEHDSIVGVMRGVGGCGQHDLKYRYLLNFLYKETERKTLHLTRALWSRGTTHTKT
jgi:hypothetical protein